MMSDLAKPRLHPEEVKHYRRELDRFLSEELKGHERLMRTPPAAKRKETPFEITPFIKRHSVLRLST